MLRKGGWLAVSLAIVFGAVGCFSQPPDSGVSGTFFVAHTIGPVPTPFPTAPPWPHVNGEVVPGPGTLTIHPNQGEVLTIDVNGAFRVPLHPGRYTIVGTTGSGQWGSWGPMAVTVSPHSFTRIRVVVIGSELP